MPGTFTISGLATGLQTGEKVIGPLSDTGSAVVGQITDLLLASGDNTIGVPSGATHVLISLPVANQVTLKVRSNLNSSDGGMPVGLSGFVKLPLPSGTTSVIINAAGSTGAIEATFI